ncbi:protein ENHANCED DISEASE RESISTANCE [Salix suchowensis]|nr:protein ENHANCED DISEASE RESISTANCE [Salix suchowensis]
MNGGSAAKIRLVRCPKCWNVLVEPQDIPVYTCGGCSTYLRAKIRKSNPEVATSGLHETDAAQKNRSDHITEAKESSISNHEETLLYSGERSSDQLNGMDSAASGYCDPEHLSGANFSDEPRGSGSDRNGSGDFDGKQPGGVTSPHNQKNESDKNDPGESDNESVVGVGSSNEHQQNGSGQNESEDSDDLKLIGVSLSSDDQERGNDSNESPEYGGISTEARNDWSERNDSSDCNVDQAGFSYKVCSPTKLDEELSPLEAAKPIAEVNEGGIQQNESGAFSDEQPGSVNLSAEAENDGSDQNESEDCVDSKLIRVSLSSDDQERGNDSNESPECDQEQPEIFNEDQIQQIESGDCNDEQLGGMGGISTEARNDWSERNDSSDRNVDQAGFSYKVCSPTKLDEELSPLAAAKPIAEVNEGEIQQNESGAFSDQQLGRVNLSAEAENDGSGQNESEDCVDSKLIRVSLSSDDQERGNDSNESPECDQEQPEIFSEDQIQQIESGDCNDEQLGGMGGISTEARNDWSERNDSSDCNVDQAGFSYKVCSPTKPDEELSPLAAAKPIAEVNEGGIQQNESGASSDEQLGSVYLSAEAENDGSDQNDSLNFSIQQAEISYEVCSSDVNKEPSPLAREKSKAEVRDDSSPLTVAKAEFDANNDSDGTSNDDCSLAKLAPHENKELSSVEGEKSEGGASSGSSQLAGAKALLDASKDSDSEKSVDKEGASVVAAQRPAGESNLSDIFIPSLNEQLEKLRETGRHDFDCVQVTDTFKTIALIDPSSELSDGLIDLSKSPTTRSSRAYYDDAASSYEGTDDRLPDRPKHQFRNTHKQANHAASIERPRSEKFVANSSLEMQHHLKSPPSIISDKNHRALKFSKLNDDKSVEHTRVVNPARNWRTLEKDFLAGYDKGSPSNLYNNESHSNPYFHSRDNAAYTGQEKMKLLEMIYELQDQVNILHGKEKGRVTPGVTWKDQNPSYYDHLEQVVFDDLNYPSYPGSFRGGSNWHQQSIYPQIPFSAEVASNRHQADRLLCCCPQDWCLAQQPPPILHHNRVFCKANDLDEFYLHMVLVPQLHNGMPTLSFPCIGVKHILMTTGVEITR